MLFATATLAARIDRAEAQAAVDYARAAAMRGADVLLIDVGGTHVVYGGPNEPFNKLAGLGFGVPLDEASLARAEAEHDARGAVLRVEYATLADREVPTVLNRRGYELIGFENVLGLDLRAWQPGNAATGISVTRIGADQGNTWIETVTEAFWHPDVFDGPTPTETFDRETLRRVFDDICDAPGMALYLARIDSAVAGGGAVRALDGLAQLNGAATLPAFRRRGVQSALLRERLRDAATHGCDIAVVATEPGSKSQHNVQRVGFELLYARAILVRQPRTA
jgi:ribosomal protein S18 acetylase RimI-like enzyme